MKNENKAEYNKCLIFGLLSMFALAINNQVFGQINIDKIHYNAIVVDAHAHNLTLNNDDKQLASER